MRRLASLFSWIRAIAIDDGVTLLRAKNALGSFCASSRGVWQLLLGRVHLGDRYAIPAFGPLETSIFARRAAIFVNWPSVLRPLFHLENRYFSSPISFGGPLAHEFLNPPVAVRSKFRMLQDSILEVRGRIHVGQGFYVSLKPGARLTFEDKIYVGKRWYCALKTSLRIGCDCLIGDDVTIIDYDGHQIRDAFGPLMTEDLGGATSDIVIEDRVWISHRVTITKGVVIGQGSIVAPNSYVTRSVPRNSLVMGNPATVVKENVTWQNF
jgi:acetyltransferase-like isoleucine patch superfamily enzyme